MAAESTAIWHNENGVGKQDEKGLHDVAMVLQKPGSFAYERRAVPALQSPRDVLVRVVATGLCGSDVHYWKHGRVGPYVVEKPIILGHESAGIVEACGPDVKNIEVGDRVTLEPGVGCRSCKLCRSGRYNLCPSMQFAATPPYDGTLSTHYILPEECCFRLPPSISLREGALVEPLSVAVHCCKLAGDTQGKSFVIFGAGPIGLLCGAVARAFGASNVVIVDIVESRLAFAKDYSATEIYQMGSSVHGSLQTFLSTIGIPDGPDIVIEASGAEPCIQEGVRCLRRGGVYIQAGLGTSPVSFPIAEICDKEAIFKGSFRYGPGDYALSLALLGSSRVNVKALITHEYEFEEAEQAFVNIVERRGIKSVIYGPGDARRLANQ